MDTTKKAVVEPSKNSPQPIKAQEPHADHKVTHSATPSATPPKPKM